MEINPEILKKYARGECSEQERLFIENWLEENDATANELSDEEWKEADKLIWQNLQTLTSKQDTPTIPLYKKWSRYAAAACLFLALLSVAYFTTTNKNTPNARISVSTGSKSTKKVVTSGIAFTVFAESDAKVESNADQSCAAIEICGKMEMLVADETKEAEIFAACEGQRVSKKVSLKKGNKYFVFTENNKVTLVDYAGLRLLSPYQKARIMHKISGFKVS